MSKFVQEMEHVSVPKHVKDNLDESWKQMYILSFVLVLVSCNGCRCKEIQSCRLPLESCRADLRLLTVMIS